MAGVAGKAVFDDSGRTCRGCGVHLAWERFHAQPGGIRGRASQCRACVAARKAVTDKRPEARKSRAKAQARYRLRHPDRVAAQMDAWLAQNPTYERDRARIRYAQQKLLLRAYVRKWLRRTGKAAEYRARRRALLLGATPLVVEKIAWPALVEQYAGLCAYCGKKHGALTLDHVTPISRGGLHVPSNVVPACRSCNASKGNRTLLTWLARKGAQW